MGWSDEFVSKEPGNAVTTANPATTRMYQERTGLNSLTHAPDALAAGALACLYLALMSGHLYSIDGLTMYRQALSLAYAHSLHFAPPILWGGKISTSKYGLGLSLLYLPGLIVWSRLAPYVPQSGSNPYNWSMFYQDPLYSVAAAPIQALVAAASAYLVARMLRELGFGETVALWGLALYGLASPAVVYAKADWAQPLAGLCWIASFYAAVRIAREFRGRDLWIAAVAVGYGVLTRPVEGTLGLLVVLAVLAPHLRLGCWPRPVWRSMGVVMASYVCGMAITMAVNWGRYGSPLIFGYTGEGWTAPLHVTLPAALLSPGWGIIWEFPAILLVPLGVLQLHRMGRGRIGLLMAGLAGLQLLSTAAWHDWAGGWNWGLRLFLPALPLAAVLAAAGVQRLNGGLRLWVPALLFIGGVVWAIPCVLTNLLAGYAGTVSNGQIYVLRDYAPIGAWQFFHGWNDLDLLWTQTGGASGNASLIPGLILVIGAATLAVRAALLVHARPGSGGERG